SGASAPGVTSTTIKIGYITDLSGGLSSSFGTSVKSAQGVVNMINAQGGIAGRKLQLVTADDGSSTTQGLTAAQSLVSQGVFAIDVNSGVSPLTSYKYLNQQGVPVVGISGDGPEWSD